MPDPKECFPKEDNSADHTCWTACIALANAAREFCVGTGEARPDVVVRVRCRVVPVRAARTSVRAVVPVAAEKGRIITQVTPATVFS